MSRQTFLAFLILAAIVIVFWQFVLPAYGVVEERREELAVWESKLQEASASKEKLKSLEEKYQKMEEDAVKVLQALPSSKEIPGLLVEMEALSSKSGLVLNSINFSQEGKAKKSLSSSKTQQETKAYQTIRLDLSMAGDMTSLRKFLEGAEKSLRLMDIESVNFSTKSTENVLSTISIGLNVYYK
jgi:Tfp pilus assembly protein PilO